MTHSAASRPEILVGQVVDECLGGPHRRVERSVPLAQLIEDGHRPVFEGAVVSLANGLLDLVERPRELSPYGWIEGVELEVAP